MLMATARINGVRLFYEVTGTGEIPIVFVHGSWGSHHNWDAVVPRLSGSFRVITYDRRGHSESERLDTPGSVEEDVADAAALIQHLELAPVVLVGNSFGASIALRCAVRRPDLIRGLVAHEPPLFSLLAHDPQVAPMLQQVRERGEPVVERIDSGDHAGAAELFVETIGLGPGSWAKLPEPMRQTFIRNAPTFSDEWRDPETLEFDLRWLDRFDRPALLSKGEHSPPTFAPVIDRLARAMPRATVIEFKGAGHIPHVTHPDAYVEQLSRFVRTLAA
jgi:pimeloyl-ACP methyl ester carboxylesterase